jgi:hypothetical protein
MDLPGHSPSAPGIEDPKFRTAHPSAADAQEAAMPGAHDGHVGIGVCPAGTEMLASF